MILSNDIPQDSPRHQHAALLGYAAQLIMASPRKDFRIRSLAPWVLTPITLGQIEFAFNLKNQAVGYATWAYLSDEVEQQLSHDPNRMLHVSEWNEGTRLWLIDVVAPFGGAYPFVRSLLRRRFASACRVRGLRANPDGSLRRIIDVSYTQRQAG